MPRLDDAEQVHPRSRAAWRRWLAQHHTSSPGVWVVTFTTASGKREVTYDEIVEELLCVGWIDSTTRTIDHERSAIYTAPRKRGGTWAATNKARVERLIADGLMTEAGLRVIDQAKADGSWTILDPVEALEVPDDLAAAFARQPAARRHYDVLTVSAKKQVLWSLVSAKRPATRQARLDQFLASVTKGSA